MGSNPPREEYELDGKGLFVIVKQVTHDVSYRGTDWSSLPPLDYDTDLERLLKTFNLKENKSFNLEMGTDLQAQGSNSFDDFMSKRVLQAKFTPSFVMFFLMSHGFNNGEFFLSTSPSADSHNTPARLCCEGGKHKLKEECHGRHVVDDIISKVCEHPPYKYIPKIFIIQTCRGTGMSTVLIGNGDPASTEQEMAANDLLIPRYPEMFVYRACIEGQVSYVRRGQGSLLLTNFCDTLEELDKPTTEHEAFISLIYEAKYGKGSAHNSEYQFYAVKDLLNYKLCAESMTSGWLTSVCTQTTRKVSQNLVVENYRWDLGPLSYFYTYPIDKQQPHMTSTLGRHLSCIKLIKKQWA